MQQPFNEIFGQNNAKEILNRIIKSTKIPHAFIFSGPEGIGKEYCALGLAKALNERYIKKEESEHTNKLIAAYTEPYIKYIFPLPRGKNETESSGPLEKLSADELQLIQDEITKKIKNPYHKILLARAFNIKISSIRDIKKFLSLDFSDVPYRFIIISDAHLMNEEAQNALLKALEEPPEGVIFILITPYPSLLRSTIVSRCWSINFQPLNNFDIKEILIKYYGIEDNTAEKIAPFSGGSVTYALRLIEHEFESLLEKTVFILRYSFGRKYYSAMNEFSAYLSDGDSETIILLINMIIVWLNDIQKFRLGINNYFFKGYVETLEKFNKRFPEIELNSIVAKLEFLSANIQNNINLNLLVLNLVFELSALTSIMKQ